MCVPWIHRRRGIVEVVVFWSLTGVVYDVISELAQANRGAMFIIQESIVQGPASKWTRRLS